MSLLKKFLVEVLSSEFNDEDPGISLEEKKKLIYEVSNRVLEKFVENLSDQETIGNLQKKKRTEIVVMSDEVGVPDELCMYFKLEINFDKTFELDDIAVEGSYNREAGYPNVVIYLVIPYAAMFKVGDIPFIKGNLLEAIAHEVGHLFGEIPPETELAKEELKSLDDFREEYLDSHEMWGHFSGWMASAIYNNVKISSFLDEKIDNIIEFAESSGLPEEDVEALDAELRKAYSDYAVKNFSSLY